MDSRIIEALARAEGPFALATVLSVQGSAPRHPGTKLLARGPADFVGTVGGGKGELLALEEAGRRLAAGGASLIEVEMLGSVATGAALICGGLCRILVERPEPSQAPAYAEAARLLASGRRALLVKRLSPRGEGYAVELSVLSEDGKAVFGSLSGIDPRAAEAALGKGAARFSEKDLVFYDPLFPREKLLVLGGGHVGRALAAAALPLGFEVSVADDREGFPLPGQLPPEVRPLPGPFAKTIAAFSFDPATYVVILTHGHLSDLDCLRAVLPREYRYAGMIGSARKTRVLLDAAKAEGFDPARVDAVCAPLGLDVDAETPAEIAVAALCEMVAYRRNSGILPRLAAEREARRSP